MTETNELTELLINRAKNLQEFVVERDIRLLPLHGVIRFDIQHTVGEPARIFVPALNQQEAEYMVNEWIEDEE